MACGGSRPPAVVLSSETGLTERDRARLLLSRATYGARPGDLEALVAQGTESWLDAQLQPERIKDPVVDAKLARFDNLELSTAELMKKYPRPTREERQAMQNARERGTPMRRMRGPQTILRDLSHAKLVRSVHSERQLHEVMTDFWFNHFNVYARKNRNTLLALPSYERDAIRPHALGSFHDLLLATAEHPAMLFYLDNWINTKDGFNPREALRAQLGGRLRRGRGRGRDQRDEGESRTFGINENYARELMELHTLGVDGGYDQQDVVEVARAMTGWSVVGPQAAKIRERIARRAGRNRVPAALLSMPDEGNFFFNQMAHDESPKTTERIETIGRRNFLRLGSSTLFLLGGTPLAALARPERRQPVLVVVFQRGAADALHMIVPYRDPKYRELRGALALEEPGRGENPTLDLGGGLCFPPRSVSPLPSLQVRTPRPVLGTRLIDEGGEGGLDDGLQVIRLLSRHPSTARFVSTKLAKRFVSDTPSDALVNEMSDTFSRTDGDISAVLAHDVLVAPFRRRGERRQQSQNTARARRERAADYRWRRRWTCSGSLCRRARDAALLVPTADGLRRGRVCMVVG